ncbi:Chromosome partitioning ATPase, Mrp family, contains Fe-S cluster [Parasphingorhabdus marina DSM 22363]|uniref:Chromosome partitioning ATPase, Mrp family, contains Fe-S cluster n=1 Tax=Parasphingorhabdus marina DSM 22363 TaxID=1123272 RepID=A0A1N6CPI4_9SPHN|nr:CpsD/CapB family tyrosine-protein kinase [Parasphingorhabdus marina]SIN60480.1 Chromosome partitioning ATPase, Mrp family, contains Fe-S cluster [Parasphingorhabdus marina DSM 22363]
MSDTFTESSDFSPPLVIPTPAELEALLPDEETLEENHVVGFRGNDIRSRPFNLLRSQVVKELDAQEWKILGMTSATPAAGKSFLSLNLAAALSRLADQTVYLFDFDLRRGSLAEALGIHGKLGLGEFLEGKTDDLKAVGHRINDSNLAFFPCYRVKTNSAEMLAGKRFEQLMEAIARLPDDAIVICDLPPAFANDDTLMIAQFLDAYMLVIEQGITTKKQMNNTVSLLKPTPCLGTVLNRYVGGLVDPYGYGYGSGAYSKYYAD